MTTEEQKHFDEITMVNYCGRDYYRALLEMEYWWAVKYGPENMWK